MRVYSTMLAAMAAPLALPNSSTERGAVASLSTGVSVAQPRRYVAQLVGTIVFALFLALTVVLSPAHAQTITISSLTATPASVQPGQTVAFTATMTANENASNYHVLFSLRPPSAGPATNTMQARFSATFLAGVPLTEADSWTVPAGTSPGAYALQVAVFNSTGSAEFSKSTTLTITAASVATPPQDLEPPVVSGTAQVGKVLTSTTGTWTGAISYAYQWAGNAAPISGATAATYTPASSDVGHTLTSTVTATGSSGLSASATSAPTVAIAAASSNSSSGTGSVTPGPNLALYQQDGTASSLYYTCSTNYYVTASASGSGSGTSAAPWTFKQAAAASVLPGSCINVAAGSYSLAGVNPITIPHGGTNASTTGYVAWRCQTMPFSFSGGVLQGEGTGCHLIQSGTNGGSLINGLSAYLVLDGFEFDGNAFATQSSCIDDEHSNGSHHHIWILNSDIHGCGQSGMQLNNTDWLYILHSVWHDNSATNGVDGSGLSIYEPTLTSGYTPTAQDNTFKSTTAGVLFHIVANYNVGIHNYNNFAGCTDGEGIIFDDWGWRQNRGTAYAGNGLIMGNIMYFNGGGGTEVFSQTTGVGATWVVNNTMYNDYWSTCNAGTYRGDLYINNTYNTHIVNNIAQSVGGSGILADIVPFMGHCNGCGNNSWQNNIAYPSGSAVTFNSPNTFPTTGANKNLDNTNPLFVSVTASSPSNNFALKSSSPAIGFGQPFDLWQQSGSVDAGACVSTATSCP